MEAVLAEAAVTVMGRGMRVRTQEKREEGSTEEADQAQAAQRDPRDLQNPEVEARRASTQRVLREMCRSRRPVMSRTQR